MNKIQEEHLKPLVTVYPACGKHNEVLSEICLNATLKHMKGLLEYAAINYRPIAQGNELCYWFKFFSQDKRQYTTEQLIEEYIKQL